MAKIKEDKPKFNYNTSLGDIIKYCKANDLIFEINEKGSLIFNPIIIDLQKELDKKALLTDGNCIKQIKIKGQGIEKFSNLRLEDKEKRVKKSELQSNELIHLFSKYIPMKEITYTNNYKQNFPAIKLINNTIIVLSPIRKDKIMFIINPDGSKKFVNEI